MSLQLLSFRQFEVLIDLNLIGELILAILSLVFYRAFNKNIFQTGYGPNYRCPLQQCQQKNAKVLTAR